MAEVNVVLEEESWQCPFTSYIAVKALFNKGQISPHSHQGFPTLNKLKTEPSVAFVFSLLYLFTRHIPNNNNNNDDDDDDDDNRCIGSIIL